MEDRIEALDAARRRMLAGFLVAFVTWQLPALARQAGGDALARGLSVTLGLLGAVGALAWLAYGFRLVRLRREIGRDPDVQAALDDERIRALRDHAFRIAFWVVVVFLGASRLMLFAIDLPASLIAQSGLVLAPSAAIAAFLLLDRE